MALGLLQCFLFVDKEWNQKKSDKEPEQDESCQRKTVLLGSLAL